MVVVIGSGTVTPDYNGALLEIGKTYTLTAKPLAGNLFAGWTGSFTSPNPVLSFPMQSNLVITANFIPNPFIPIKGKYYGLLSSTNTPRDHNRSGSFLFTLTDAGAFSGSFQLGAKKLTTKGAFNWLGETILTLKPSLTETVTVVMQLDLGAQNASVDGAVGNGDWNSGLRGYRAPVFPTGSSSPLAGKYTLILPGNDDPAAQPARGDCRRCLR